MDLPSNLSAERGLLGLALTHNAVVFEVGNLEKADFSEAVNGELWDLIRDKVEAGGVATAALLLFDVQDAPIFGELKASEYLARLEAEAPPPSAATELAHTIREAARRARGVTACRHMERLFTDSPVSVPTMELFEKLEEAMAALRPSLAEAGIRHAPAIGDVILERLRNAGEQGIGLELGLKPVQDLIGALQPGRLYILGGSPGSGKSAMAAQLLAAVAQVGTSLLFTPEMAAEEVVERQLAAVTGVGAQQIERAMVSNPEFERLFDANDALRPAKFFIDDTSKPSLAMIRGKALRKQRMGGLDAIGIDHCHYLSKPDKRMAEFDALDENLEGLKGLAKDLRIPIIVVCQLGTEALRDMAKWPHRRPTQGDLLYSGIVERHADVILMIHRPEYFLLRNEPAASDRNKADWDTRVIQMKGVAELILAKRRGGGGYGVRRLGFEADRTRFTNDPPKLVVPDLLQAAFEAARA